MKKVLSVLLAAAMVMGMSVSAFAADAEFGPKAPSKINYTEEQVKVENLYFADVFIDNADDLKYSEVKYDDYKFLAAGDVLYFPVYAKEAAADLVDEWMHFAAKADKDWVVKVKNAEFVEDAEFLFDDELTGEEILYVAVTLAEDFNHYEEEGVDFYFYIYDKANKASSEKAIMKYEFEDYPEVILCDDCVKGCTHKAHKDAKFVSFEEELVEINTTEPVLYSVCDECYTKSQEVNFVIIDKDGNEIYFEATMIPGEEYLTKITYKLDKKLTKAYDVDMYVLTIDTELKVDALFDSKNNDKVVLEVVDGELYEVESEYVSKYEVIEDEVLLKGYKVENLGNGQFVIVSEDADLEWEDTTRKEVVEEAPVADDKANPSTGANDFVGAAVALAVVSVAAAGALAFKK